MYWIGKIILFFTLCGSKSTILHKNSFLDTIANKILELDVSLVYFWNSETSTQSNLIYEKITSNVLTVSIDTNETKVSYNNPNNLVKILHSGLLVMIRSFQNFNADKIRNDLYSIARLNSSLPRAKFLIILIGDGDSRSLDFDSEKLLIDAWDLKFLDISMLTVNNSYDSTILSYNPFFKKHQRSSLSSGELFPDKLQNMNGNKIKTIIFNKPPHIEFVNKSNKLMIRGINSGFLKLTSEALNFAFDYVEM